MDKAEQLIKNLGETRYDLPYDIDGAVMKLNSLAGRARLGSTAKFPVSYTHLQIDDIAHKGKLWNRHLKPGSYLRAAL